MSRLTRPPAPEEGGFFEALLGAWTRHLAVPTDSLPSVRCLSSASVRRLLREIFEELAVEFPRSRVTQKDVVERLVRAGLLTRVQVRDPVSGAVLDDRMYRYELDLGRDGVHPFELLQAAEPGGVIAYHSALLAHELTTQPCAWHHIAVPTAGMARGSGIESSAVLPQGPHPLGTAMFAFEGATYYRTLRDPRLLSSFQRRHLDARTMYRVTTLEQTLLDTLHRPRSAGGPAVVFEAWERAAEDMDLHRVEGILRTADVPGWTLRAGWMLVNHGRALSPALESLVDRAREKVDATEPLELLPGFPSPTCDRGWNLKVPSGA